MTRMFGMTSAATVLKELGRCVQRMLILIRASFLPVHVKVFRKNLRFR